MLMYYSTVYRLILISYPSQLHFIFDVSITSECVCCCFGLQFKVFTYFSVSCIVTAAIVNLLSPICVTKCGIASSLCW